MSEIRSAATVEKSAATRSMEREKEHGREVRDSEPPVRERESQRSDHVTFSHDDETRPENHPQYNERGQVNRRR